MKTQLYVTVASLSCGHNVVFPARPMQNIMPLGVNPGRRLSCDHCPMNAAQPVQSVSVRKL